MKKSKAVLACCTVMALTGCSGLNFSVDNLLNAPNLTEQQSSIHSALTDKVGKNITLKYPKNGDNRSAFVIANLDDEPDEEALAFYKYNSVSADDSGVRINLLDKDKNGSWHSVKELSGSGTDIDRVILTNTESSKSTGILIGYQSAADDSHTLEIYSYKNGNFKKTGKNSYALLDTVDINSDGKNEVIAIHRENSEENGEISVKASLINIDDGSISQKNNADMYSGAVSYTASVKGKLKNGRNCLYIDSLNAEGKLQTELIYYRYSKLQNPMSMGDGSLISICTRPNGYYCKDIDSDGIVEIPGVAPMTGYENAVENEMLYMTYWYEYADFYKLDEKHRGFYNIPDGYFFTFPKRWEDKVTIKKDTASGEYVFFKYNGDINSKMEELMRIGTAPQENSSKWQKKGYTVINSKDNVNYMVRLADDKEEQLVLTIDEVQNNFIITN